MNSQKHFQKILRAILILFGVTLLGVFLFFFYPLPNELTNPNLDQSMRILDRNGKLLYELRPEDLGSKNPLKLSEIPLKFQKLAVNTEDKDFFTHNGISPKSILRAWWQNTTEGQIISGGSTITQQLVRNRLQPEVRDYTYKISEAYYALRLELLFSKDEILEQYLNSVYFGRQAYGVASASQAYFGKNITELSWAESAFLIGLIQSPNRTDMEKNLSRKDFILDDAYVNQILNEKEYTDAKSEQIQVVDYRINIQAPHFVMWLLEKYQFTEKEIFTTLNLDLQNEIETIVQNEIAKLSEKNVGSGAVVVLDSHTGDILAMVGSADYFDIENNGAVNVAVSARQPGSALKPFTYALALEKGDTPATTVSDIESRFQTADGNPYIPRNYDYLYHGLVRYREALANSYNIPAVRVAEKVGVKNLLNLLRASGITTLNETPEYYGLALTLGAGEVRLLDLTSAYGIFARGGQTLSPHALLDEKGSPTQQLISPQTAWLITDILSDNEARLPQFGENSALKFDFPVAAKTGTTRNSRDNWMIGFDSDYIVGVWVGNADNTPMRDTSGVTGAGPIFHAVMLKLAQITPPHNFIKPTHITSLSICRLSGKLPTELCPETLLENFREGTEPKIADTVYQKIKIDTRNNFLANESCPTDFVSEKVFTIFPPELEKWARENNYPVPPKIFSPLCNAEKDGDITITKPYSGDSFQLDPLVPDTNEKIIFEARANLPTIDWLVDDQPVGQASGVDYRLEWAPTLGSHKITARSREAQDEIRIEVISR